jgi:hypothetical protein
VQLAHPACGPALDRCQAAGERDDGLAECSLRRVCHGAERDQGMGQALAALGPADGPDVRGMPDGTLLHLRDTYPIETAWAPQYVGDQLRQVRAAAHDARLAGLRAAAEAAAARHRGDHGTATRQHELAASYQAHLFHLVN